MANKTSMTWTDARGRRQRREIRLTLDVRRFEGMAGYPLLVLAANPHLSVSELLRWLEREGYERGRSWAQRRLKMFRLQPKKVWPVSSDGRDAWAMRILRENPGKSARQLAGILRSNGMRRSQEWINAHR